MATYGEYIKSEFPKIDEQLYDYIESILTNGADEFEDSEEVYEAIGEVLHEIAENKTEVEIRNICDKLLGIMKPDKNLSGPTKVLNAPIHLASMAANLENNMDDIKSIWVMTRDDGLKVDAKKLEKAEAKLQMKLEKRSKDQQNQSGTNNVQRLDSATASQVTSKKETRLEDKGMNKTQDIRIENFDISYGNRVLLQGADLTLAHGRRYGLVGRNGLGKTTLLRMLSCGQLRIPSHVSVLHVEQEVVGNETLAIQSVLECDTIRENLLSQERELSLKINSGSVENGLAEQLNQVYHQLQAIEADKAPARASIILSGLGFSPEMQQRATREFSGGWRMRLALARALFSQPDLLLLDEPTNMLDMKAIIWLESYLQSWPTTLLVVSHDRHFLDTVPTDILFLHSQKLDCYRGNYESFHKARTERLKNQQREYESQQQHRAHVQVFIDRFRYNANRAASVQSKLKLLAKLPELRPVEKETEVILKFPQVEPLSPPILQLDDVSFSYVKGQDVLKEITLNATLDSRICIVGDNGAGKTTLLKLVMGIMAPTRGQVTVHRHLRFGYFSQHHVDQLDMDVNCVELLQKACPGQNAEEYRRQLGGFGISGDTALQTVASLSGGQKSRVAFARMCLSKPNFLVLDEPTNHLDIETIEALGKALNEFTGGVILVSHDERLIRAVCRELWVCGGGAVKSLEGGFDEYRRAVERELDQSASNK